MRRITNIKECALSSLIAFLIQVAENYLEYMQTYDKGFEIIKIQNVSKDIFGMRLQLEYKLKSTENLILCTRLGEFVLEKESEISILSYDEKSKALSLTMSENLCNMLLKQKESLQLISDLKFLIQNVIHFYSQKHSLQLPTIPPPLKPDIDALKTLQTPPHLEQLNALKGIFEYPFCYIWGAAGSGKTKVVLLHALAFYLKANIKVAILAPTNNALEQCLITLLINLDEIGIETSKILRLGTPSQSFAENFPKNCDLLLESKNIDYKKSLQDALVIAMTLDTFLRRSDLHSIDFKHFFIDEAGFSPLIKTLPLCAFNKPITLLGDHKQLQPICILNSSNIKEAQWKPSRFWQYSALFMEKFFDTQKDSCFLDSTLPNENPPISHTFTLTQTYRYGHNLAQLLNHYIYKNNLQGLNTYTHLYYLDTSQMKKMPPLDKADYNEATQCCNLARIFLDAHQDFAILTPFVNQRQLILKIMPTLYKEECVFTIHSSQGQEFDYIFFSPVILHYHLNNSDNQNALFALNVAFSRAKKGIILVCNKTYWLRQSNQFLSDLIKIAKPYLKNF
ncbi:AAA domain-containing protein [uncultured Helicobacter sp.]|uniref:AAA domain-containing protein n=1 Tax=uncultured Helicobacter sp. TaxID=175537 RepID=UPI0026346E23|nr:AAA domain-containing protein [uncultured Helicobacter sp.]